MLRGIVARARSLWRGIRRRDEVEADMNEEFRLHQELRAADLVRSGLTPAAAERQARLEFGSAEMHKDAGRRSRGLGRIDELRFSWLDFKLGFRMLARYPGLTLVGGLAMAFAIWIGAGVFELVTQVLRPSVPLADGQEIVAITTWDAEKNQSERRVVHDFLAWKHEVRSITELGAFRELQRNLIVGTGGGEPVEVAEITASIFGCRPKWVLEVDPEIADDRHIVAVVQNRDLTAEAALAATSQWDDKMFELCPAPLS